MPIKRDIFLNYIDSLLQPKLINDYCPNGLQVQGKDMIETIVTGVTASDCLIKQAVEANADALIVHHGMFFKGELETITGWKYKRIQKLIKHDISLIAYHLPLDIHPVYGNNIQLAQRLNLTPISEFDTNTKPFLGLIAKTQAPLDVMQLSQTIESTLKRTPTVINANTNEKIQTIGICTGSAQDFITHAKAANCDLYLSGEISERTTHLARELGIHYIAAGHHATERFGVLSLGEHLAKHFRINHQFIDIDNPA